MARLSIHPFTGGEWASPFKVGRGPDYQALTDSVLFEQSATSAAISGTASISFTVAGNLNVPSGAISGAVAVALAASGSIGGIGAIAGAASLALTVSGAASGVAAVTGSAGLAFAAVGSIGGVGAVSASSAVVFDVSGSLGSGVAAGDISGSADIAFTASGVLTGQVSNLHGRKPRGRRVIYPDELPPVVTPVIEPLPSLAVARQGIADAKAALEVVKGARVDAQARKDRQRAVDGLTAQILQAEARYEAARVAEARIMRRLHDEDELFLLAA